MDNCLASFATINPPECLARERQMKDLSQGENLDHSAFLPVRSNDQQFEDNVSNNLIGALSMTGTIHHPDNLVSMEIPFFWCNYCDFNTVQKNELLKHLQLHCFRCKYCSYEVLTRGEVIKHILKCHREEITNELLFCYFVKHQENPNPNPPEETLTSSHGVKRIAEKMADSTCIPNDIIKKIKIEKDDINLQISANDTFLKNPTNNQLQICKESVKNISQATFTSTKQAHEYSNPALPSNTIICDLNNSNSNEMSSNNPDHSSPSVLRSILTKNVLKNVAAQRMNNTTGDVTPNNNLSPTNNKTSFTPEIIHPHVNVSVKSEILENPHPVIKIEIDDDSYSNSLGYVPKTVSLGENINQFNQEYPSYDVSCNNSTMASGNDHSPSHYLSILKDISSTESDHNSHQSNISKETTMAPNASCSNNTNSRESSPPANVLHLPILRTMLTSSDLKLPRHPRKNKNSVAEIENGDDSSMDSVSDDDTEDADYCPNSSEEDEVSGKMSHHLRRKSKEIVAAFACLNCENGRGMFKKAKEHLLAKHTHTNLILKDVAKNTFVYICPTRDCNFKDSKFTAFIAHLESCGVFDLKTIQDGAMGRKIQLLVLKTFQSLLKTAIIDWLYACSVCAKTFQNLNDAQCHKVQTHPNCFDKKSLFKSYDVTGKIVILCMHCLSEIEVTEWPNLSLQDCSQHQNYCSQKNSSQSVAASHSHSPKIYHNQNTSNPDHTPQLRAILQKSPQLPGNNNRQGGATDEDLPASRMLQWLISEGSRMMHFLKE
ncbi:uncharacterized protein LOC126818594 [Patella vulgata]|uniref:uncharacterized protein LOC126818594 n=1 Tax=Patella vulgata TaxID=6465 RepID=UPI0021803BAC|nr:uncharacterized protein LOC126818594 [Patella vulgata]XP_050402032.1 uncharacterized protein LOC126818594 [Patella vulgata]XP_050402033.1 uncharacterized protein LOC126818594 [Patella vulgata]